MEGQYHFILASLSPRRKNLLKLLGFPFRVIPGGVEDRTTKTKSPRELVEKNSLAKATAVADTYRGEWVLGADTVVVINDKVLGKPEDESEALKMLLLLSGETHTVYTGVSLVNSKTGYRRTQHDMTTVTFSNFSSEEALSYINTGEPGDKAGAYGAQGAGSTLIERIEGSYTNVVGLPLSLTVEMLKEADVIETSAVKGKMYQLKNIL
jgi:septum formation protein